MIQPQAESAMLSPDVESIQAARSADPAKRGAECGIACVAMIAGYHGFRTDLSR